MLRKCFLAGLLMVLALCAALLCGCADEDDDDDEQDSSEVQDLLDEGRYWLIAGIPVRASEAYGEALNLDPENPEAHYGAMTAASMKLMGLISLVTVFLADPETDIEALDVDPNRDMFRKIILLLTDDMIDPCVEEALENASWLNANGDPVFLIDSIPVFLFNEVATQLGVEFDGSERVGSEAFANLFGGLSKTLSAIEIDLNLDYIFSIEFGDLEILEIISLIVDLIDRILNDPGFPDTFRIDPDRMDAFVQARFHSGLGFLGLMQTVAKIQSETDPQGDDVLGYQDQNGNGLYDPDEPIVIPGIGPLDEEGMDIMLGILLMGSDLGAAFLDRTDLDVHPDLEDPFHLSTLNTLLAAFGIPPVIPDGLTVDIASFYENVHPDTLRDFLRTLVDTLRPFLPEPPDVF